MDISLLGKFGVSDFETREDGGNLGVLGNLLWEGVVGKTKRNLQTFARSSHKQLEEEVVELLARELGVVSAKWSWRFSAVVQAGCQIRSISLSYRHHVNSDEVVDEREGSGWFIVEIEGKKNRIRNKGCEVVRGREVRCACPDWRGFWMVEDEMIRRSEMESVCHWKGARNWTWWVNMILQSTKMKGLYDVREGCGKMCRSRGRQKVIDSSSNLGRREYKMRTKFSSALVRSEWWRVRGAGGDVYRITATSSSWSSSMLAKRTWKSARAVRFSLGLISTSMMDLVSRKYSRNSEHFTGWIMEDQKCTLMEETRSS